MLEKPKILILSAVPMTLWVFYRGLIRKLQEDGYDLTIASSEGKCLTEFQNRMGCRILPIEIQRRISLFSDVKAIFHLTRHLRKERYDIIHAHTPKAGMIGMFSGFLARTSHRIYTMHGMPMETAIGIKRKILCCVEFMTFRFATSRLIVSKSLSKRAIEEKICKSGEFEILADGTACGIDRERFNSSNKNDDKVRKTRREYGISQNAIVIGFVGRVVPDKGIECLLDAFDIILKTINQEIFLLIIGEYETVRESISDLTRERIEENEKIVYGGTADDIVPCYHAMDMLVLPSKREGFNYVLIEAAACGLPTVTTRATGCIDAVVDNETGFVVEIDNSVQLSKAMCKLIENSRLRHVFGLKGEERVSRYFNSDRLIQEHMKLYNSLILSFDKSI